MLSIHAPTPNIPDRCYNSRFLETRSHQQNLILPFPCFTVLFFFILGAFIFSSFILSYRQNIQYLFRPTKDPYLTKPALNAPEQNFIWYSHCDFSINVISMKFFYYIPRSFRRGRSWPSELPILFNS